ncbi:hypothetical protein [Pseudooceanicola marinus]|uniref:spike base protein, RCAP_Rcc01079 family n=1 Tax=Pseudooceanicola marinus TaxID=396013 RepID=UPI001CD20E0C|nr:hypothetical protein [Pseudooceanicola marinus]MCA1338151.1 hypothetical protein [Pseudooceanicola marinus]
MKNPFKNRVPPLTGPGQDILPVTPDDATDLPQVALSLYVEGGGDLAFITAKGESRVVAVTDFAILPVATRRVLATGTTASGIHAFLVI